MIHQQIITLKTGREVKVTLNGIPTEDPSKVIIQTDVQIKEPREEQFHVPIHASHPKYWKLKVMSPSQARMMYFKYSGLSKKQMRKLLAEFEHIYKASAQQEFC
ncbi:hypothetical protein [Dyadobacter sp. 3J3]|uniref:hypothetical protein n=1 Tax=Dyadobacter sp. 3J3 TaxID=2606600 RepID=UPI00135B054B|nr:hypothetical protein [Dyadobacter sp. 3J3]